MSQAEKTGVSKKYANILAIPLTRNTESSHPTPPGKGREAGEAGKARKGARGARGDAKREGRGAGRRRGRSKNLFRREVRVLYKVNSQSV